MRGHYSPADQSAQWTRILLVLGGLIFAVLIIKFMMSGSESVDTASASLRLPDTTSSAEITTDAGKQKDVNANTPLSALDLIEVKTGRAQVGLLKNPKDLLTLNAGTKLRYLGDSNDGKSQFRLENKDLWVQSDTADMTFDLMWLTLIPSSTTVLNVSKNELFTTITVLQGSAIVDLNGSTQEITAGKQLNYSTLKTLTPEDITTRITPVNADTLTSDWMSLNGASAYMQASTASTPTEWITNTVNTGSLILFESPIDESTIESKSLSISGRILSPLVSRVVINGAPAVVDPAKQTFTLANVSLTAKENNIVYRTYDVAGTLLSKGVITVYTTAPGTVATTTSTSGTTRAQVETYKPDNRFRIVAPSSDFFETRETKVKIEGRVTANTAHHITINDFKLNSFTANGTSWYYFANQQFGNMQDGVNSYTIRYFDAEDHEIYKQLFVIKKLSGGMTTSGEVTQ
jgi:hypothetical protein